MHSWLEAGNEKNTLPVVYLLRSDRCNAIFGLFQGLPAKCYALTGAILPLIRSRHV
ncbi:MAG: hypothetical protein HC899_36940 [Leptolyngbyaceae cyanobacterium SM1_4_3]|nr:hypothetical protein [Leptolyngbyaceae cyanobacterium SM1_4_3]